MTTYILAGGNDRNADPLFGDRLAAVVKTIVPHPTILSCFLSWPEETRHERWQDYLPWFNEKFGDVDVLEATRENFYDLAEKADVIYLHGGRTKVLLDNLPDYERSAAIFQGKIVIGSSAGAKYLSTYSISMSEGFNIVAGSGIIGHPVLVHYRMENLEGTHYASDDWVKAEGGLLRVSEGKSLLCLPEGSFSVIVQ